MAKKADAVRERAERHSRELRFGIRLHVITRDTSEEAWAEAQRLLDGLDPAAIAFVNRVAEVAETHNHHPDMLIHGWNKVKLSLTNHAAGGLTEIDFDMAARFDALVGA